jgi:hypothetical protein
MNNSENLNEKGENVPIIREPDPFSTEAYLQTLNEKEYKAYLIAKSHLGTSFQLEKSNGYLEWRKEQKS